ncbi:hypothetical protein PIB30_024639 [Stylosanthes scabra]|uniref:Uncharacterized protein n=1 Tax=Stylosanthes scabra TaxID=79078 RepID=A0ABU6XBI5_9FABA|nr:hypothetical protein [Stylosanthes scabra]
MELRQAVVKPIALVYEKIDGGKKNALEDGEVVIQSSKYGKLTHGNDTCFLVSIPLTIKAATNHALAWPRRDPKPQMAP